MSLETLDLGWFLQIARRIWAAVGAVAVCGLVAGIAVVALHPPTFTSTALIVLPEAPSAQATAGPGTDGFMATQLVIASSDPVLSGALPHASPALSLKALRGEIQFSNPAPDILSISAAGATAAQAEATANAVADSYIAYVRSPSSPIGRVPAELLAPATSAAGRPLLSDLLITGGLGALLGALIGAIDALAFSRSDRRFRAIW
jgi:uncharacterized protein involved in exopolysaccharide biosynthesis